MEPSPSEELSLAPSPETAAPSVQPQQLNTKVVQMSYSGGIIGMLLSNKRKKLEDEIQRWNDDGYRLRHVLPGKPGLADVIVQAIILVCTFMLYAPTPGEALIFERNR